MTYTSNNNICVAVDTDTSGLKFMVVYKPKHVSVTITKDNNLQVCVNDSCVFNLCCAETLIVNNQQIANPTTLKQ